MKGPIQVYIQVLEIGHFLLTLIHEACWIHKLYQHPLAGLWHLEHFAIVTIQRYSMKIQFSTSTLLASEYLMVLLKMALPIHFPHQV